MPNLAWSQANCSSPNRVDICPTVYLANQTNAGMMDDAPVSCNIPGEDLVYEIFAPNQALHIFVSLMNATGPLKLSIKSGNCLDTTCNSYFAPTGNSSFSFTVDSSDFYYVWVDASATVEFDISFGGDTSIQAVNIPNTQGVLSFDSCASNAFNSTKPFFEVSYNGIFQTDPMTLTPLNLQGRMCVSIYLQNTSGVSGAKTFLFAFDAAGYSSIVAVDTMFPGFYNIGNWRQITSIGNQQFTFSDSAGIGRGDFDGNPNTCLRYDFCFDLVPLSNDPNYTNVVVQIISDDYGSGYNGLVRNGCCPYNFPLCLTGSGTISGGATGLSFGFNDPGSSLPVSLTNFTANVSRDKVFAEWSTTSEINNDYFTLERSQSLAKWEVVTQVKGSGNSTEVLFYQAIDNHPISGLSYYRLRQTDYDGQSTLSKIKKVNYRTEKIPIYPNPADQQLTIEISEAEDHNIILLDPRGRKIECSLKGSGNKVTLDMTDVSAGIYFLFVTSSIGVEWNEKIIVQHPGD